MGEIGMDKEFELGQRQVLMGIGNRYVVFGPMNGLPQTVHFDPDTDGEILPRVADEHEIDVTRIGRTLRVHGMTTSILMDEDVADADFVLTDRNGEKTWVDLKVREHGPRSRDLTMGFERIRAAARDGRNVEVWNLNVERLGLAIQSWDASMPRMCELPVVDVWEKTPDGVFRRQQVVDEVDAWQGRIDTLYANISQWLQGWPALKCDASRKVTMSEELMQAYAVPDRELPVLDVLDGDKVVASFVPRGLWIIGAWGRVDVITQTQTRVLVVLKNPTMGYEWRVVAQDNRPQTSALTKDTLMSILELS